LEKRLWENPSGAVFLYRRAKTKRLRRSELSCLLGLLDDCVMRGVRTSSRNWWTAQHQQKSAEGRVLDEVLRTADLIISGKLSGMPKEPDPIPTIRQLGTLWTSGELHKQFPDHIKKKSTADDDAGRFEKHVYPVIGEIPIDAFTLDHANLVMAGIPAGRAPATRRHVAQLLHRICAMALFPLRVIKTNPLPEGFLPPIPAGKAKSWLYPDEDTKLLCAKPVPLAWRVFYGFLHREGTQRRTVAGVAPEVILRRAGISAKLVLTLYTRLVMRLMHRVHHDDRSGQGNRFPVFGIGPTEFVV
jgi:hypothetical protein